MSTGHRLIDYFAISGLDVASGLEPDQFSGDNLHCPPLERPYKAAILAHYPEVVSWNRFDAAAVCMLSHPKGVRFVKQQDAAAATTSFHPFVITKEDGTRSYGAALTFYEPVDDARIIDAMQTLQAMHMAELSNAQSQTLYSHLGPVYARSPRLQRKTPSGAPADLPTGTVYNAHSDKLLVSKSICVTSPLPLVATFERLLRALLAVAMASGSGSGGGSGGAGGRAYLPLESYVHNMLYELPLLPPGRSMRLCTANETIVCQRPGTSDLPLLDCSLHEMFKLLGVDRVLNIFTSVLLEHQILLYSKDYRRLMLVAEGISSLIFPFNWPHVYVPILPTSLLHFLDAPVPFIMGVHHCTDSNMLNDLCAKANMCFVDIDQKIVELPEDFFEFPYRRALQSDLVEELSRQTELLHAKRGKRNGRDPPSGSGGGGSDISNRLEKLHQSSAALAKITELAKKTGVITSLDDISNRLSDADISGVDGGSGLNVDEHTRVLMFNSKLREIFLNYMLQMFAGFENFVIQPGGYDRDSWLATRESVQNFDKAAFLSDQPEAHLAFLSAFLETQMFLTFIDNRIVAQWEEPDANLHVFELRVAATATREQHHERRAPHQKSYLSRMTKEAEEMIAKQATIVHLVAPTPHPLEGVSSSSSSNGRSKRQCSHTFPLLCSQRLNREPSSSKSKGREGARWRKKDRLQQHSEHLLLSGDQKEKCIQEARIKSPKHLKLNEANPVSMMHTNSKFVFSLLKECKTKTKRMLVEKMGQEAVELGHSRATLTGVEENTLIATLCDMLERVWGHGLQSKQGRSDLWSHLLSYQEVEQCNITNKPIDPNLLTPDLSSVALEADESCPSGMQTWPVRRHRKKSSSSTSSSTAETAVFSPLPVSATYDMRCVQQMSDIRTAVGCARAWVRLALEKKLLSRHLKELLSNVDLLKSLYKRYAFLRSEDEREQFLYHLLSLNAVDYYCFTNSFTNTVLTYRILIFPCQRQLSGSTTTANCWLCLAGKLGQTKHIDIPKHTLDMTIKHKNLGILTTLRIGHDNAGISPKWMVQHILVRNEVSGHTYRFPCGRWLGKSIDDGSLERLLVAEPVPAATDHEELLEKCQTPPRCRSPSMPRRSSETNLSVSHIQAQLGDAVNNLVKHYYKPEKERGSVTGLLCGEYGLVYCMELVFQYGFKSSRLFRNRFFIWDFLEKVQGYFATIIQDNERYQIIDDIRGTIESFYRVISRINEASESIGKDGRFQMFICVGVRDHVLQQWIKLVSKTPIAASMYEEQSFLRDASLLQFLIQILGSLKEFDIELEAALVKGVNL